MGASAPVVITIAVALLAGCTGADEGLPLGTCLETSNGEDADFASAVGCDEPHRYDVLGTATWPDMEEVIALDGAEAVYDEISALRLDAYWDWADDACQSSFRVSQGLDELMVDGNSGDDLYLNPAGRFFIDKSLPARERFLEGDTATLCSIGWLDLDDEQITLAYSPGVDIRDFVSGDLDVVDAYSCFDRVGQGDQPATNCSEPHNGQYLLLFDGAVALDAAWIESLDPESLATDDYAELDDYCTTLINAVYPGVLDDPAWGPWGDHLRGFGGGWTEFDGTVDPDQRYMFYCGVLRTDADKVAGSVVIGDPTGG